MRISDWSSDVCSSDLLHDILAALDHLGAVSGGVANGLGVGVPGCRGWSLHTTLQLLDLRGEVLLCGIGLFGGRLCRTVDAAGEVGKDGRSEEHTSELQSLMRISYAVFCLKKKKKDQK